MFTSTRRYCAAGLVLALAAGCASVTGIPAPAQGGTPTAIPAGAKPAQDNAGWRRIHAGAGRT